MEIKRGDIWYVDPGHGTGSEQNGGRPAIIVSNDANNRNAETVEVVYLTCREKADLPTHVTIRSTGKESTALCEQITTVSTSRLTSYKAHCTDQEMQALVIAMMISLGLEVPAPKKAWKADVQTVAPVPAPQQSKDKDPAPEMQEEVEKYKESARDAQARCKVFEELYQKLLERFLDKKI